MDFEDLFRVSRDAYGQETLIGVSWDLVWLFIGAAVIFIAAHALWRAFVSPPKGNTESMP